MTSILIDSNILIDVWGAKNSMTDWSASMLAKYSGESALVVDPIVWAELAPMIDSEAKLAESADMIGLRREPISWGAAFLAGQTHSRYRKAGGERERTLPDFLVGAHAVVAGHILLTRDPRRYRSYFPNLAIIAPDTHP